MYIRSSHGQGNKPDPDIQDGLFQLASLELFVLHSSLTGPESLYCHQTLFRSEKPRIERIIRKKETPDPKDERQNASENVNILPRLQGTAFNLGKAIVEGTADDSEPSRTGEPPALARRLLSLCVEAAHYYHESGWNDRLGEAWRISTISASVGRGLT